MPNAGIHVYGLGAMALGVVGLVWGDFTTNWQPVQALPFTLPYRTALVYIVAACLFLAGAAIQWRPTDRAGALSVAIVNFLFAVLWLPRVIRFPQIFGTWGGFFEAFSPVTAGALLYATLGTVHLVYIPQTANMVPKWIPPGQTLWAVATGIFHLLAGIAILSGVLDVLASRLLTLMLILFGGLVWAPQPFAHPHDHTAWGGNAVNLALIGTAWVIADYIASRRKQIVSQPNAIPQPA